MLAIRNLVFSLLCLVPTVHAESWDSYDIHGMGFGMFEIIETENQVASEQHKPSRDQKKIMQTVSHVNKTAIFKLYRRELRKNPNFSGQFTVVMTISPEGQVTDVFQTDSTFDNNKFENRVLGRYKLVSFGQEDVKTTTVTFSFELTPS